MGVQGEGDWNKVIGYRRMGTEGGDSGMGIGEKGIGIVR